jgi:hypothetical protein
MLPRIQELLMVFLCRLLSWFIHADLQSLDLTYSVKLYEHSAHFLNCSYTLVQTLAPSNSQPHGIEVCYYVYSAVMGLSPYQSKFHSSSTILRTRKIWNGRT